MKEVGLIPSNTGKPGGKKTDQRMTRYIEKEGPYQKAFEKMPKRYILPFTSLDGEVMKMLVEGGVSSISKGKGDDRSERLRKLRPVSRKKTKYTCLGCKANVWGKPGLKLICGECDQEFQVG